MITSEEQITICKEIVKACMWGYMGHAHVIAENLQKKFPTDPSWSKTMGAYEKEAMRESVGVVTQESDAAFYIEHGYLLCNYEPGELSIHAPRGGGLYKYIVGPLADKLGEIYDPWNFRVHKHRAEQQAKGVT